MHYPVSGTICLLRHKLPYLCIMAKELSKGIVGNNPFITNLKVKVTEVTDSKHITIHTGGIILPKITHMEHEANCKLYINYEYYKTTIDKLTPYASKLFNYICSRCKPSHDYIEINVAHFMKTNKVGSRKTYNKAMIDLLDSDIVVKMGSYANVYWINPRYIFSGSRVNKYPNNLDVVYSFTI